MHGRAYLSVPGCHTVDTATYSGFTEFTLDSLVAGRCWLQRPILCI